MRLDAKIDDSSDSTVMNELRAFLNKDIKVEDSSKIREQLMTLLSNLEKEKDRYKDLENNTESLKLSLKNTGNNNQKKLTFDIGFMVLMC